MNKITLRNWGKQRLTMACAGRSVTANQKQNDDGIFLRCFAVLFTICQILFAAVTYYNYRRV